jgi:Chitobiase/beta-hexosaminidase C-terminal domain
MQFDGYAISDVTAAFAGSATASTSGTNYVLSYTPQSGGSTYTIPVNNVLLDGATGAPVMGDDSEQVLDIAQAVSMAPGLSQVRVYIGNLDSDILNAIASENIARQVSISWAWSPDDPDVDDVFFEEMAAQGQSVFAASGDYGAYDFIVASLFFPAEDPYVTAVGGTSLQTSGPGGAWVSETAWDRSGGGISPDLFDLPSWQTGVATSSNHGSASYRNVPDVAMEADFDNYDCDMGSCSGGWGGTSFAAPRWAGYMALVNQKAQTEGEPPLGFLNPALYSIGEGASYATAFHDITEGNNGSFGQQSYFYAVSGYDLVTGLGSPAGGAMVDSLAPTLFCGFQLSASPTALKIEPGSSGTTTITVDGAGGFTGPVSLTLPALPPGVSASFSTNPVATSTVLTVTVDASTQRGSFLLLVSGNANGQTTSAYIAVEVDAPGFTIAPSGPAFQFVWIAPGYASSTVLNIAGFAGFSGTPSLAIASPLPPGVTAVFNPSSLSTTSLLTFIPDDSASQSQSSVIVSATSGEHSAKQTVFLAVTSPQFRMNFSPEESYLSQGVAVSTTVSAYPVGNYTGDSISLSTLSLPAGVTATFSPATIEIGQSSTLTLTASNSAALGSFYLGVTGSSGDLSTWTAYPMTITAAPQPWFSVTPQFNYIALPQSGTFTDSLTVTDENGFTGLAWLEPPGAMGLTVNIQQTDSETGSGVATYAASATAVPTLWASSGYAYVGSQPIGSPQAGIFSWILVTPTLPFILGTPPGPLSISSASSISATISITPQKGYSSGVNLSASGMPEGMTASFSDNPTSADTTLTVNRDATVPPGAYYVNVAAEGGGQTLTRTIPLLVETQLAATPAFSVSPGTYNGAQVVSVSDTTPGAVIYYTTDSATPTTSSTLYTIPIIVSASGTLRAIATAAGYSTSAVASAAYNINYPNPIPEINSVSPPFTNAGNSAFTLTVQGSGFISGSVVDWGGSALETQYVSATELTAQVTAEDIAATGIEPITVLTPTPDGSTSNVFKFEVDSAGSGTGAGPEFGVTAITVVAGSAATDSVTLTDGAIDISVTCLNLPVGAACSYSAATGSVTFVASSATPVGVYPITIVITETLPGSISSLAIAPILLLPLVFIRRRQMRTKGWFAVCLAIVLFAVPFVAVGCGGGSGSSFVAATNPTHQETHSGSVSLTVQ